MIIFNVKFRPLSTRDKFDYTVIADYFVAPFIQKLKYKTKILSNVKMNIRIVTIMDANIAVPLKYLVNPLIFGIDKKYMYIDIQAAQNDGRRLVPNIINIFTNNNTYNDITSLNNYLSKIVTVLLKYQYQICGFQKNNVH